MYCIQFVQLKILLEENVTNRLTFQFYPANFASSITFKPNNMQDILAGCLLKKGGNLHIF